MAPGVKRASTALGSTRTRAGSAPCNARKRRRVNRLTAVTKLARFAAQRCHIPGVRDDQRCAVTALDRIGAHLSPSELANNITLHVNIDVIAFDGSFWAGNQLLDQDTDAGGVEDGPKRA